MTTPYIPNKDADFDLWLLNFSSRLTASPTTYGLTTGNATAVAAVTSAWSTAFAAASNPYTRTPVTVAAKDTARVNAEMTVRPLAVSVSRNLAVTDSNKTQLGVTVPDPSRSPVPPPTTSPALVLQAAVPGIFDLQFRDATDPTRRAKPVGVIGIEIWLSVGTVPATDPSQCTYVGTFTRTPMQLVHGGQPGKVATMFARWTTRSGSGSLAAVGPWSLPLVTTTI